MSTGSFILSNLPPFNLVAKLSCALPAPEARAGSISSRERLAAIIVGPLPPFPVFGDDGRQRRRCRPRLDDRRGVHDVLWPGWSAPEPTAQNPHNEQRRQPDANHVGLEAVFGDDTIQPEEHRVQRFDRMLIHAVLFSS